MRWGIVLACAIIGTLIFPIVGTMIGALIGCVIGASPKNPPTPSPVAIKSVKKVVIESLPAKIAENNPTFGQHNYINPEVLGYLKVNNLNVEVSAHRNAKGLTEVGLTVEGRPDLSIWCADSTEVRNHLERLV